jgi:hypothetical protein
LVDEHSDDVEAVGYDFDDWRDRGATPSGETTSGRMMACDVVERAGIWRYGPIAEAIARSASAAARMEFRGMIRRYR